MFQPVLILLLSNVKKILLGAFEVFTSTLLEAFDGLASTFLDYFDVAVSDGKIASLNMLVLKRPVSPFDRLQFLPHGLVAPEHFHVIGFEMLFLLLLNDKA